MVLHADSPETVAPCRVLQGPSVSEGPQKATCLQGIRPRGQEEPDITQDKSGASPPNLLCGLHHLFLWQTEIGTQRGCHGQKRLTDGDLGSEPLPQQAVALPSRADDSVPRHFLLTGRKALPVPTASGGDPARAEALPGARHTPRCSPGLSGYFCCDSVMASCWAEVWWQRPASWGGRRVAAYQQRLDWLGCCAVGSRGQLWGSFRSGAAWCQGSLHSVMMGEGEGTKPVHPKGTVSLNSLLPSGDLMAQGAMDSWFGLSFQQTRLLSFPQELLRHGKAYTVQGTPEAPKLTPG